MNGTSATTTGQGTTAPPVSYAQLCGFARICATTPDDALEHATPMPEVEAAIRALFPNLDTAAVDRLWDRGRMDAAALHQLQAGDVHRWPVCDMDPPRLLTVRYIAFLDELESSVEFWVRDALTAVTR